jgi:hypothetical protein
MTRVDHPQDRSNAGDPVPAKKAVNFQTSIKSIT